MDDFNEALMENIKEAMAKIFAQKEADICRYIPSNGGGYIHHFTFEKLKKSNPEELNSLIKKYIINVDTPQRVEAKTRAPRGSRNPGSGSNFTRQELEILMDLALKSGNENIAAKLTPKNSLAICKKQLIAGIKNNQECDELFKAYKESLEFFKNSEAINANENISNFSN